MTYLVMELILESPTRGKKDGKLLLNGYYNSEPPSGNDFLCAKLQALMLENLVEDTEEE
jgi:hypothetical protein